MVHITVEIQEYEIELKEVFIFLQLDCEFAFGIAEFTIILLKDEYRFWVPRKAVLFTCIIL